MFERFTDGARRVVVLAQEEARMLNHDHIGTEHLLLGLIHEGQGVAAEALESLGISLEAVRREVEEITGRGRRAPSGHVPFTARAKTALEQSLREALQLGHSYIGTEHILLGLTREDGGVAAQVLIRLGADLNRVREQVIRLVGGAGLERARSGAPPERTTAAGVQARLDAVERRLAALEQRVGSGPGTADLDQQIAGVRRDKEAAIEARHYERAASLRERERTWSPPGPPARTNGRARAPPRLPWPSNARTLAARCTDSAPCSASTASNQQANLPDPAATLRRLRWPIWPYVLDTRWS
jgi:Clp amino terminal domain, pathogenicity island component